MKNFSKIVHINYDIILILTGLSNFEEFQISNASDKFDKSVKIKNMSKILEKFITILKFCNDK